LAARRIDTDHDSDREHSGDIQRPINRFF